MVNQELQVNQVEQEVEQEVALKVVVMEEFLLFLKLVENGLKNLKNNKKIFQPSRSTRSSRI
jgi:hypothetical protein